jgi:hypothetical protein
MSELSNYIELLLRDDMPKAAKERLAEMIKEAELNMRPSVSVRQPVSSGQPPQSLSTQVALARHGEIVPNEPHVEQIGQTPAAQAALNARAEAMAGNGSRSIYKATPKPAPK